MTKKETLEHWKQLEPGQPIMEHMRPLAYKSTGSTYGACGIRIDGNPAFIDAVLSRLQDMMEGENGITRLGLARNTVDGKGLDKDFHNKEQGAEMGEKYVAFDCDDLDDKTTWHKWYEKEDS